MSANGKAPRPGNFCSNEGEQAVDEWGQPVACVRKDGETRRRWRRPEGTPSARKTNPARRRGGRRVVTSATYTGTTYAPTLPYMPVVTLNPAAQPAPAPGAASAGPFTAAELELLHFEDRTWISAGVKETAIRDELQMSATRYYQLLNQLLNRPETLRQFPGLVSRLDRMRTRRRW